MNQWRRLRALAGETVVYGIAGVASRFIGVFLIPVYTRLFTPADYGVMSLVATGVALISVVSQLGLDSAASRWYWDTQDLRSQKQTMSSWLFLHLAVATVLAAIVLVAAARASDSLISDPRGATCLRLAALQIPLSVPGIVLSNLLRAQRKALATTIFSLTLGLSILLLTLWFVVGLRWGIVGVFAAQAIGNALASIVALVALRNWIRPSLFDWRRAREMLLFGLPLVPTAAALWIVSSSDRYFLQFLATTTDVGIYQVGYSVAALVALMTTAFQAAVGPFILSIKDEPDALETYARIFLLFVWVGSALCGLLWMLSPEALRIVTTPLYLPASRVVGILALSYVAIGLQYIGSIGLVLSKVTRPIAVGSVLAALVNVALNVSLIPVWGVTGAAASTLVSQMAVAAYLFYRSGRLHPIPYRFGAAAILIVVYLVAGGLGAHWELKAWWLSAGLKTLAWGGLLTLVVPLRVLRGINLRELLRRRA